MGTKGGRVGEKTCNHGISRYCSRGSRLIDFHKSTTGDAGAAADGLCVPRIPAGHPSTSTTVEGGGSMVMI